ncbi:MAG: alpha/beta hydrolase fold domain-containing protein [Oscillospiraceae bacterium]|nr:alpha/beta hydrolase fold domain-containing protein [Oscillospiraceae bacterium]
MKKKYWAAAAGAAAGAWCIHRNRKYPVCPELRFANKLAVPGWTLNLNTARLANRSLAWIGLKQPAPPQGIERRGTQIPSEDGTAIRLTIYRPEALDWAAPCLVYFHGGGFCLGDAGYIHRYAAQYAEGARCMVVFVHYRTSEAAPFPTPFQDCYAALRWVWDNAPSLRVDRARLAVGGDSAGGALAAACALRARDENGPRLCFQLLVYPVTDCRMETVSMKKYTDSPLWNAGLNRKMWELYLRDGDCGIPEYAAPMLAHDFSGLPPTYVEVEEFDCLHDEGAAYAQALQSAGVDVQLEDIPGTFHGFDFFSNKEVSKAILRKRTQALQLVFWR